jgi:drug/metabolite transporter (DMT)-like permease
MKISTRNNFIGEGVMLLVTILWGATFVIVKESLTDVSSMLFIAIRFSIAGLILLPLAIKYKKFFTMESILAGGIIGLLLFGGFATQTVGLKFTTATKSGFLTGSAVVMVPILQTLIEKKRPSLGAIVGVIIVFIGILLLSSGGNSVFNIFEELGSNFNIGDMLTLVCAFFFALYIIYIDVYTKKYEHNVLILVQIITTAFLAFLFSFIFSAVNIESTKFLLTNNLLFGLFYTSLFATLITTYLQTRYQNLISPTKASIIFSFEPVFAALFAFFILNEKITNLGYVGATLIFTGLIVSEILDKFIRKDEQRV